jgi:hypothetical protein
MISKEDVALNKHWIDYEFLLNVHLFKILQNKLGLNTRYPMPTDMKENFMFKISPARTVQMTDIGTRLMSEYCYDEDIDEDEFFQDF